MNLKDLSLEGKKVLIRVDFNVPLDKQGNITDDTRLVASLPTIKWVIEKGGFPILMSHLGRPKGKPQSGYSLAPCAKRLAVMLGKPVIMAADCVGDKVEEMVKALKPGESLLLENLRFHPAEENPESDPTFAKNLAQLGSYYVNDAFGTAHRKHASTYSIVQYFPGKAVAGFLLEKEIEYLGGTLLKPKRPFYAILGGAKVSTKIGVLKSLVNKVDAVLIGGAMAYTFLKAKGVKIGDSLFESELVDTAKGILDSYQKAGVELLLPVDHVLNDTKVVETIPNGFKGMDIGPKTVELYTKELSNAKTVFWNGPMGVFEDPQFAKGTKHLAEELAKIQAVKIIGGGDSVSAIRSMNLAHKFSHLSTGGGASLEYIEHGTLPGIEVLEKASKNAHFLHG